MTFFARCSLLILSSAFLWSGIATAQAPPAGAPPPPTNIKALPKGISRTDLIKIMRQYTGDLGVECAFCHAQDPATKRLDFASDANPMKEKARFMIEMTDDLNNKYLTQMPNRMYADPITCGTCHQGQSHPAVFVPKPQPPRPPAATPPAN
jgi:Photosynthetic reaction centre cytochrome C subunit